MRALQRRHLHIFPIHSVARLFIYYREIEIKRPLPVRFGGLMSGGVEEEDLRAWED